MGYKVRRFDDLEPFDHPFGNVWVYFSGEDHPAVNIAQVKIIDDRRHYHKKATEFYYVLRGRGRIYLDSDEVPLAPGTSVLIEPGTRHRAVADVGKLDILVVSSPPYSPDDEFFD